MYVATNIKPNYPIALELFYVEDSNEVDELGDLLQLPDENGNRTSPAGNVRTASAFIVFHSLVLARGKHQITSGVVNGGTDGQTNATACFDCMGELYLLVPRPFVVWTCCGL